MGIQWVSKEDAILATGLTYHGLYRYVQNGELRTKKTPKSQNAEASVEYSAKDIERIVSRRSAVRKCELPTCSTMVRASQRRFCSTSCMYKARYKRKQEKISAYHRERRKDPLRRQLALEKTREWVNQHPERASDHYHRSRLKTRYGITPEEYSALGEVNDGACWICNRHPSEETPKGRTRRLVVDHDHNFPAADSLGVRGLLCTGCNVHLVAFEDTDWKLKAESYLAAAANLVIPPSSGSVRTIGRLHRTRLYDDQFLWLLSRCGSACEICQVLPTRTGKNVLNVDHDHKKHPVDPGFIRGLLCSHCNTRVGKLEHPTFAPAALEYLSSGRGKAQAAILAIREASRAG